MPARYVRPYSKGQKNDFRDAEAIAEAVQRPTMKFVATKTAEQLDLQALHRVRERLVASVPASSIESVPSCWSAALRCGRGWLLASRVAAHPGYTARCPLAPHGGGHRGSSRRWRRLDERIERLSGEIEAVARQDAGCERLMSVPGIGPIISSAMVAAIGREMCSKGRDFAAWLGLVPEQISTGDRTILGKISKRGNRYLRVLFVQAAWVVLIKPKSWERQGSSPGSKPPRSGCTATCWRSRSPTSSPASPGAFWLMAGTSRRGRSMRSQPNLPDPHSMPTTAAAQNEEPAMT